jgi:hypothetical protein
LQLIDSVKFGAYKLNPFLFIIIIIRIFFTPLFEKEEK